MALLTATSVTRSATTVGPNNMTTSDTVSQSDIGTNGALLNVINGSGSSINVTLADPGSTAVGNAGNATPEAVPAGADRWFRLSPGHVNSSGVATVNLSAATSVTYKLIRC
ncbi:hypothetical protein [Actinoplanes sp. N902-109]|uniref:hypothetical protein n=1 Tax=Actinoplanes sp. (strain N902-109) TaxID=649831 RepID=UPI00032954C3|nr:hypothetical protein [Actinoplanes sp. N902-109]AGL13879.1 hypothetical protein L083_0369 [Actinoplanes sp. N902-109]